MLVITGTFRIPAANVDAARPVMAAHGQADHIKAWRAAWPALGIGERDLTLFETSGSRPI